MKKKVALFCTVIMLFLASSITTMAMENECAPQAICAHTYVLQSRTVVYEEQLACVTAGCTVTRTHYSSTYRCNKCRDTFAKSEVDDHHSMTHH
mgnify:FL=1